MADQQVLRNDTANRYELWVDGAMVGIADYIVQGDTVVLPHTVIDPSRRGQGLGAVLVQGALDDIRAARRTVIPSCWYVREYIEENPDQRDLLAA